MAYIAQGKNETDNHGKKQSPQCKFQSFTKRAKKHQPVCVNNGIQF